MGTRIKLRVIHYDRLGSFIQCIRNKTITIYLIAIKSHKYAVWDHFPGVNEDTVTSQKVLVNGLNSQDACF